MTTTFDLVSRGTMRRLARHGREVAIALYACRVTRPPFSKNGKTYMHLDLSSAAGDLDALRDADQAICQAARPAFSPVAYASPAGPPRAVIVKLTKTVAYSGADAAPAPPFSPAEGDLVDVVLTPGAFGSFGYCVLVSRLKPHALKSDVAV